MTMTQDQLELLRPLGVPYVWDSGGLYNARATWPNGAATSKSNGIKGYECSFYAQAALLAIGLLREDAWHDLRAVDLANACVAVKPADAQVGDMAFYGNPVTHVMMVLVPPTSGRRCMVIGASGGRSTTHGDMARACVQVYPLDYRRDLLVIGRVKTGFRP